ncbi:MAG: hypothetical protein J7K40_02035 [candidate division Zixibacteria bacterium]|nr:hypothetical protein [candidate division Zixibacteria bacterium]
MYFILGVSNLIVLLVALAIGVLFAVKAGLKKITVYFILCLLCIGLFWGSAGLIIFTLAGGEGIKSVLFSISDKLFVLSASFVPFLLLLVSLHYGQTPDKQSGHGLGVFIRIAAFITFFLAVLTVSGFVHSSIVIDSEYIIANQGFLARVICLFQSLLTVYSLVNFESVWRLSTGNVKKQFFLLIIIDLIILAGLIKILFLGSISLNFYLYSSPLILFCLIWLYSLLMQKDAFTINITVDKQAFYSSAVILFLGFFLIFIGVVGKFIMMFGGNIEAFLSAFGAFLVISLFFIVALSDSIRQRFGKLFRSRIYAGRFDYKAEWRALSENFAACDNLDKLLETIDEEVARVFDPSKLEIFEALNSCLYCVYPAGQASDKYDLKDQTAEWLFLNAKPVFPWQIKITGFSALMEKAEQFNVVVPLVAEKKLTGIVFFGAKKDNSEYSSEGLELLSVMGHQAAVAILHLRSRDMLLENEKLASFHRTASFVVHDLKNAVSMLSLMLQNAPSKMSNPEFQKESIRTITQAVDRMQKIIEKLKATPSKEQFQLHEINLKKVFDKALRKSAIQNKANIDLQININDSIKVKTDANVLGTVFENLLINAVEAMPKGGTITADDLINNGRVIVSIADTGIGISESFIKNNLFRPFQTTKTKGLGIGLYQCREMFRETGGDIIVESELGKGSTFMLVFGR